PPPTAIFGPVLRAGLSRLSPAHRFTSMQHCRVTKKIWTRGWLNAAARGFENGLIPPISGLTRSGDNERNRNRNRRFSGWDQGPNRANAGGWHDTIRSCSRKSELSALILPGQ